ncbi:MAG: hypothetical protein V2A79_01495 [Planctomycetota bacterium]
MNCPSFLATAFTYQGQLKVGGVPVSDSVDLECSLWTAAIGGVQVDVTQSLSNVEVVNGLFTVDLDFGPTAFIGNTRWLKIVVNGTPLSRQALTAAPYAIRALSAANAAQLNGQPAAFYQSASNISSGTLGDLRLSSSVALLNTVQTFTGAKTFSLAPAFTAAGSPFSVTSATRVANLNADRIDGLDSTAFLQSIPNPLTLTGSSIAHIIRGENASTVPGASGVHGLSTAATGQTYGGRFESTSTSGRGVYGTATADSGFTYGVYGLSGSTSGRGVFGTATADSGATYGVYGSSDSTSGRGVFGVASATTGITYGVYGLSGSTSGVGVVGEASATTGITHGVLGHSGSESGTGVKGRASASSGTNFGVYGESVSTSGRGVFGKASATTGTTYGVWGVNGSTSGRGVYGEATAATGTTYGVYGSSDSTSGRGVYGKASAITGDTYGGRFESNSTSGSGVYGIATAATGGGTFGVWGESFSPAGRGVYGLATAATGYTYGGYFLSNSPSGRGVYGTATATTGTIYGVYGYANTAAAGYAVYANGDMGASGTKPFRIDHPDDPANKYLLHYAAESPEVINFYRGTVMLDGAGEAVVELPHYFAKINRTPGYQLTAVGAPMPMLHVAEEIDEAALSAGATAGTGVAAPACTFRIAGGVPGAKVSWRVEALRNDLWVRNHNVTMEVVSNGLSIQTRGMPVEVEKQGVEKGTYQHPEFYGQPPEKGMNYDAERERPSPAPSPDATPQ